eukprot:jgi/Ulvmu1/3994/UM184_0003.1
MAVALLQHAIDNQHPEVQSISPADLPAMGLRIRVEVPKKPSAANGGASNGHKHDLLVKPPTKAPAPRPKNAGQKDSKPPGAGRPPANGGGPGKGSGTPQSDRKVKEAMRIAAPDELSEEEVALRWQENCDHEGPDNAPTGAPAATIGAQSAPTGVGIAGNTEAAPCTQEERRRKREATAMARGVARTGNRAGKSARLDSRPSVAKGGPQPTGAVAGTAVADSENTEEDPQGPVGDGNGGSVGGSPDEDGEQAGLNDGAGPSVEERRPEGHHRGGTAVAEVGGVARQTRDADSEPPRGGVQPVGVGKAR